MTAPSPLFVAPRVELVEVGDCRVVYLNGHAVAQYACEDRGTERVIVTQLAEATALPNAVLGQVFGMHEVSLSRLRSVGRREGASALMPKKTGPKTPHKLTPAVLRQIQALDKKGLSTREIATKLTGKGPKISHTSVASALKAMKPASSTPHHASVWHDERVQEQATTTMTTPTEPHVDRESRLFAPVQRTRYAGVMMLYPMLSRLGLWKVLEQLQARSGPGRFGWFQSAAAVIFCFALRFRSIEDLKNGHTRELGALIDQREFPSVQTVREKVRQLAGSMDPRTFTREMFRCYLALDPVWEGLYYVDSHFIPYHGKGSVPYGWNAKRKHAEPGRTDVHVHDADGRALFFISEPINGSLVQSIRTMVDQIRQVHGQGPWTLVFDRGGYSGELFRWLTEQKIGFITYLPGRKGKRRYPVSKFERRWMLYKNERQVYQIYEKATRVNKCGLVRTVIWLDDKNEQLPLLTNLAHFNPAFLVKALRLRWRQENGIKYLTENYAIDQIIEYGSNPEEKIHQVDNPARKKLLATKREIQEEIESLQAQMGRNLMGSYLDGNKRLHVQIKKLYVKLSRVKHRIGRSAKQVPIDSIPGKSKRSLLHENSRIVVSTLKIAACNAERMLAARFNQAFENDDQYLSVLRALFHLHGTIRKAEPNRIVITLERPDSDKLARALDHLLVTINHDQATLGPSGPRLHFRLATASH